MPNNSASTNKRRDYSAEYERRNAEKQRSGRFRCPFHPCPFVADRADALRAHLRAQAKHAASGKDWVTCKKNGCRQRFCGHHSAKDHSCDPQQAAPDMIPPYPTVAESTHIRNNCFAQLGISSSGSQPAQRAQRASRQLPGTSSFRAKMNRPQDTYAAAPVQPLAMSGRVPQYPSKPAVTRQGQEIRLAAQVLPSASSGPTAGEFRLYEGFSQQHPLLIPNAAGPPAQQLSSSSNGPIQGSGSQNATGFSTYDTVSGVSHFNIASQPSEIRTTTFLHSLKPNGNINSFSHEETDHSHYHPGFEQIWRFEASNTARNQFSSMPSSDLPRLPVQKLDIGGTEMLDELITVPSTNRRSPGIAQPELGPLRGSETSLPQNEVAQQAGEVQGNAFDGLSTAPGLPNEGTSEAATPSDESMRSKKFHQSSASSTVYGIMASLTQDQIRPDFPTIRDLPLDDLKRAMASGKWDVV